jgi:hypothetical protein
MPRAENSLAACADAATDEVKSLLADVTLGGHVGARENAEESH